MTRASNGAGDLLLSQRTMEVLTKWVRSFCRIALQMLVHHVAVARIARRVSNVASWHRGLQARLRRAEGL